MSGLVLQKQGWIIKESDSYRIFAYTNTCPLAVKNQQFIIMDTDELSEETYKAVLITSEKFNHNLTLQFGLLAGDCSDDNDYLEKANQLIVAWKSDLVNSINDIFFDTEKPKIPGFETVLSKIQNKIQKVLSIPVEKRTFEF